MSVQPNNQTEDETVGSGAPRQAMSTPDDIVDEYGVESFPASDPPSSWGGASKGASSDHR